MLEEAISFSPSRLTNVKHFTQTASYAVDYIYIGICANEAISDFDWAFWIWNVDTVCAVSERTSVKIHRACYTMHAKVSYFTNSCMYFLFPCFLQYCNSLLHQYKHTRKPQSPFGSHEGLTLETSTSWIRYRGHFTFINFKFGQIYENK